MISRLRLRNFKRHADTQIDFSPEQQLVLIAGDNGVGKSSLLNAITWALYGEVPNVRIDQLVRRGAEFEGMEVECLFTVAGVEYRVHRRRDGRNTFALLEAGGIPIMQGSKQVTAEIARIIGMDAAGFRMAVIAQQKELDALVRKTDTERAAVISRLLRLDVVTRARDAAREKGRDATKVLEALGPAPDLDAYIADAEYRRTALTQLEAALDSARSGLSGLDDAIAAGDSVDIAFAAAHQQFARAQGAYDNALDEVNRRSADLALCIVPEPPAEPDRPLQDVLHELAEVERALGAAEAARTALENRQVWTGELARVEQRLEQIAEETAALGSASDIPARLAAVGAQIDRCTRDAADVAEQRDRALARRGEASAQLRSAQDSARQLEAVGATCPTCDQPVSDEHRKRHAAEAAQRIEAAQAQAQAATEELDRLDERAAALELEKSALESEQAELQAQAGAHAQLASEAVELRRRAETYRGHLARVPQTEVDTEDLYARKAALALEQGRVNAYTARLAEYEQVRARLAQITADLESASRRAEEAQVLMAAASVSADLQAAHDERQRLKIQRSEEYQAVKTLETEVAVARRDLQAATVEIARAQEDLARRKELRDTGCAAADAARLLDVAGKHLASTVRPALEGTVAQLITQMSNGRFTAVRFDERYNLTVDDDGVFVPVEELSGGEADLVALAVRLALAQVVVERHGAGGTGFLILDECFGSQDAARREAILNGLRNLRSTYGQILMISHVPGLDDAADAVITVEAHTDDSGQRVATLARD